MSDRSTIGWLANSLRHEAERHRREAARCHKRSERVLEPYASYLDVMYEAHVEASELFMRRFRGLSEEPGRVVASEAKYHEPKDAKS